MELSLKHVVVPLHLSSTCMPLPRRDALKKFFQIEQIIDIRFTKLFEIFLKSNILW